MKKSTKDRRNTIERRAQLLAEQTGLSEQEARALILAAMKDRLNLLGSIAKLPEEKTIGRKRKLIKLALSLGGRSNDRRHQLAA